MSFLDKIKQKAEELDLEKKAKDLADAAAKAAHQAKEKAGDIAHEQRDKVEGVLDKAGHAIDEKTEGKYHDKVVKAKDSVVKGVDKIAEQRAAAPGDGAVDEPGPYFDPNAGVMDVDPAAGDEVVPESDGWPQDGPVAGPPEGGAEGTAPKGP